MHASGEQRTNVTNILFYSVYSVMSDNNYVLMGGGDIRGQLLRISCNRPQIVCTIAGL